MLCALRRPQLLSVVWPKPSWACMRSASPTAMAADRAVRRMRPTVLRGSSWCCRSWFPSSVAPPKSLVARSSCASSSMRASASPSWPKPNCPGQQRSRYLMCQDAHGRLARGVGRDVGAAAHVRGLRRQFAAVLAQHDASRQLGARRASSAHRRSEESAVRLGVVVGPGSFGLAHFPRPFGPREGNGGRCRSRTCDPQLVELML